MNLARGFFTRHPVLRGMAAYAIIWPTGSLVQQTIAGNNWKTYDWAKPVRFCIFGTFFVAPSLYAWVRLTSHMWPQTNLKFGLTKAFVEQLSYGPFASFCFFYGMSLLEFKSPKECLAEVVEKFPPTWKVGVCVWPIVQTINFSFVPERNRVPFVSIASLCWTTFLAYMKQLEMRQEAEERALEAEKVEN